MGLFSRDISVTHDGHEIALSMACTGKGWETDTFKLYLDGKLTDEQTVSGYSFLFGASVTLRGQLVRNSREQTSVGVKVLVQLRPFGGNTYQFVVDGTQVHQERGSWWGGW